ncbi:hypothetical protein BaRGS_00017486, partial [Batillaria attramentaria]
MGVPPNHPPTRNPLPSSAGLELKALDGDFKCQCAAALEREREVSPKTARLIRAWVQISRWTQR